jgi:septal ring factor EnvC (AmiA/AmiB activator)
MLLQPLHAGAQGESEELKQLRNRIEALEKELTGTEESKLEATDALRESENALIATNRKLSTLTKEQRAANNKLRQLQAQSVQLSREIESQQSQLSRLLHQHYIHGSGQKEYLSLLLNHKDPNQIARNLHYYEYISRARREAIDTLRTNLQRLDAVTLESRKKSAEIAAIQARQAAQMRQLEQQKHAHVKLLDQISFQAEQQRREIGKLKRDEDRLTRLVERIGKMLARKKRTPPSRPDAPPSPDSGRLSETPERLSEIPDRLLEAPERLSEVPERLSEAPKRLYETPDRLSEAPERFPETPERFSDAWLDGNEFSSLKGRLSLPVRGELANRFGSPRADGGVTWKGLFIRAATGENVKAVASGRVVFADWLRGFGNLMILDHGGSYMSLYANNETNHKQIGDSVRGGDTIATVGNTGANPEPGLYFELRHQGKAFDPLNWVRIK